MEMLVYTQDRTYSSSLNESKKEEQEEENELRLRKTASNYYMGLLYIRNNHATLAELMLHLKSYYKVRVDHNKIQNIFFCFHGDI